jgi:hypothetical protein
MFVNCYEKVFLSEPAEKMVRDQVRTNVRNKGEKDGCRYSMGRSNRTNLREELIRVSMGRGIAQICRTGSMSLNAETGAISA